MVRSSRWTSRLRIISNRRSYNTAVERLWLCTSLAERIRVDSLILKLHLIAEVIGIHGFLLSAVGSGFTLALAALLEAEEGECEDENEADAAADGPDSDFGAFWEGVEFLGDGLLFWLWAGCESSLLGRVTTVLY